MANFSGRVCDGFTPIEYEGQLCYSIDINKVSKNTQFGKGESNAFTLMIDYNLERSSVEFYDFTLQSQATEEPSQTDEPTQTIGHF